VRIDAEALDGATDDVGPGIERKVCAVLSEYLTNAVEDTRLGVKDESIEVEDNRLERHRQLRLSHYGVERRVGETYTRGGPPRGAMTDVSKEAFAAWAAQVGLHETAEELDPLRGEVQAILSRLTALDSIDVSEVAPEEASLRQDGGAV
jgi:hypothetical protein